MGITDVARDADPLSDPGIERHERLVRAVIGVGELVQFVRAEAIDRLAEAAIA